jgi:hypothetical protein
MSQKSRRAAKGKGQPEALPTTLILAQHKHGTVTSVEALSFLFQHWLESEMKKMQERLTSAESASMAHADLQRFLKNLSQPTDAALPRAIDYAVDRQIAQMFPRSQSQYEETMRANSIEHDPITISALREHFRHWSQVEGANIMRLFLSDEDNARGDGDQLLAGLTLSPNRAFTWRLLFPSVGFWPLSLAAFKQQLWVSNFEFINDCIHDLGRPLPIMELGLLFQHMPDLDILEKTIQRLLTPPELAYALAFGVFQLDVNPDGLAPGSEPQRPRLKLNPLFTTSR